jgi:lon-related putative ATP-dependent protease
MPKDCKLIPSELKKNVDLSKIDFKTTADIPPLETVIGQDRAVGAINFGLAIEDQSYNIFVTGIRGTGRTTIVHDLLNKIAVKKDKPDDWLYVYNFENPDEPQALQLPNRKSRYLIRHFTRLISNLRKTLTDSFDSQQYVDKKNQIVENSQNKKRDIFAKVENEARKLNIHIKGSTAGFQTLPMVGDKPMDDATYDKLSKEERNKIEQSVSTVQNMIKNMVREATSLDRVAEEEMEALNQNTARFIVESQFEDLMREFMQEEDIAAYLQNVMDDIVENVYSFLEPKPQNDQQPQAPGAPPQQNGVDKYKINHVVDNSRLKGAPVIYEMNPTYNNLFGRIEKKSYMGYLYTDYTMIKAGSLLKANGGYLILDAEQVLRQSFVYDALKRALRGRCLVIEDINELYGVMTSAGLKPNPITLNVKVIIIGQSYIYHALHAYDQDFRKIFKVRADFDYEVKESRSSVEKYVKFISRVVREEKLRHLDRTAVKAVIEQAYRLVDHQQKMSIRFSEIVRLLREASFWAKKRGKKTVAEQDVKRALKEERYRRNLTEEKIQNAIREKTYKFDVDGYKIGQINGLAVYSLGDYSFGKPSRITASTFIGSRGIINIEREAKLSGKLHDKGVLILAGYFASRFGDKIPLSFSASLTFEQSYGMIDGDSASSTELYALLSSLSEKPINQGIAVTGSVNQKGEVQAIGGVNEKIEGFFEVCKLHRLTGKQGVIIPRSNVQNLMLKDEVHDAVAKGKFHIWAVDTIEDGIRILTDTPAGKLHKDGTFTKDSVFAASRDRLVEFGKLAKQFAKQLDKPADKSKSENNNPQEEDKSR